MKSPLYSLFCDTALISYRIRRIELGLIKRGPSQLEQVIGGKWLGEEWEFIDISCLSEYVFSYLLKRPKQISCICSFAWHFDCEIIVNLQDTVLKPVVNSGKT
jgi:hypothetical protein